MLRLNWRRADETIGESYMRRWHLYRKKNGHNLYLHRYDGSDDDRALHDHPWRSISIVLWGRLYEVTEQGEKRVWLGLPKYRSAKLAHRIVLKSNYAYTLFFTFKKEREWGFHCENGWVHWRDFTDTQQPNQQQSNCEQSTYGHSQ